jgi:hypothetical protein
MRLVSFFALLALGLTASAHGYKYLGDDNGQYVVTGDGYIGDESDIEQGDVLYGVGKGGVDYFPAPPDYSTDVYVKPKDYPDTGDQYYEETYQPPDQESAEQIHQRAWDETGGACDTFKNPHSYGCTQWNFDGNGVFPWFKMNWWDVMQGQWFSVTYVRNGGGKIQCANGKTVRGENNDCEFSMAKNPDRPTQPFGIVNTKNGSLLGSMWINGAQVSWDNWMGKQVWTDPDSFRQIDDYTVQFSMYETKYSKQYGLFVCRDFNRNSNHHLLCKWYMQFPNQKGWVEKGFMGFLTQEVWDGFRQSVH